MLTHKSAQTIKHKEPEPWEKYPPGSCVHSRYPKGFNFREYRAHTDAFAFMWDMYWSIQSGDMSTLNIVLNNWWRRSHNKPFPQVGCLGVITDCVFTMLIDRGHDAQRIAPLERDYILPNTLVKLKEWDTLKNNRVHKTIQNKEPEMAKFLKKAGTKGLAKKTSTVKKTVKKDGSAATAPAKSASKNATGKKTIAKPVTKKATGRKSK